MSDTRIRISPEPWSDSVAVQIQDGDAWATGITMERLPDGVDLKPVMRLSYANAQRLCDDLYRQGFKPSRGDIDSALGATQRHLEDMRRLVFRRHDDE